MVLVKRNAVTVLVLVVIIAVVFVAARWLFVVPENQRTIQRICEANNADREAINAKFDQLVALFDRSIQERRPDQPPLSPEIQKAYENFRRHVPLIQC